MVRSCGLAACGLTCITTSGYLRFWDVRAWGRISMRWVTHGGAVSLLIIVSGALNLSGCVQVPDLHPIAGSSEPDEKHRGSISINEVVKRIKCEIRDSIAERLGPEYKWFSKWTVSADLSLAVNDNSQISPGAVFTHQFLLGDIAGRATNVAQSSSLGIGGQASTTATRTEVVSFSMSVKEIKDEFFDKPGHYKKGADADYYGCKPFGLIPVGLTGNLGLKNWVDSALGPVTTNLLKEGIHKAPKGPSSGAPAAPQKMQSASNMLTFEEYKGPFEADIKAQGKSPTPDSGRLDAQLKKDAEDIIGELSELKTSAAALADQEALLAALKKSAHPDHQALKVLEAEISKQRTALLASEQKVLKEIASIIPRLQARCDCSPDNYSTPSSEDKWMAYILKCFKTDQSILQSILPKPANLDPPIDAISHQVQFILVWNASVNPTWTMLQFKGPSPSSGTFASATDTNTHTLTIVMGEPGSQAASNTRSSLTFGAAIASQLAPQQQTGASGFIP